MRGSLGLVALLALASNACSTKSTSNSGTTVDGGPPACAPAVPLLAWTSPYAGWSRGLSIDPSFFPVAAWLQLPSHAQELHDLGVNIFLGNNGDVDPIAASDLANLKSLGMHAIIGQDSTGLANVDDDTIAGWWMADEPDNAQSNGSGGFGPPVAPQTLIDQYNSYKAADSTRPMYLGLGQGVAYDGWEGRGSSPPPESDYVPASDIVGFDIYPYNNCGGDANEQVTCGQFWLSAFGVDRLHQWSNRDQAVWADFETTTIAAGTSSGPTPVQTASEVWLALIHGANGIIYFIDSFNPSFREDAIFEDQAMVDEVTALNAQITALAPELNSTTIPNLVTASAATQVDLMVKANGTSLYVFAAIARTGTATATFTVAGLTGNATAEVVGENRNVDVTAGQFSDAFAANDAHVYRIDLSTVTCPQ